MVAAAALVVWEGSGQGLPAPRQALLLSPVCPPAKTAACLWAEPQLVRGSASAWLRCILLSC